MDDNFLPFPLLRLLMKKFIDCLLSSCRHERQFTGLLSCFSVNKELLSFLMFSDLFMEETERSHLTRKDFKPCNKKLKIPQQIWKQKNSISCLKHLMLQSKVWDVELFQSSFSLKIEFELKLKCKIGKWKVYVKIFVLCCMFKYFAYKLIKFCF